MLCLYYTFLANTLKGAAKKRYKSELLYWGVGGSLFLSSRMLVSPEFKAELRRLASLKVKGEPEVKGLP